MNAKLLPFTPVLRTTLRFDDARLLPFLTRQAFADRAWVRYCEARFAALPIPAHTPDATPVEPATMTRAPRTAKRIATMTLFEAVPAPHPLWRVYQAVRRLPHLFFEALQPVLSVYFLVVATLCVPMALVARMWFLAGYCAVIGLVFARILLAEVRQWRRRTIPGSLLEDEG